MFHKIQSITPLPKQILKVRFVSGDTKFYDTKQLLQRWPQFSSLKDDALFRSAKVAQGGFGVIWNDFLDLSCDELWQHGQPA